MAKPIHVVPAGSWWNVTRQGSDTPISRHRTQGTAIDTGRGIAQDRGTELVIHRPNGQIRDKDSYGNDPCPPRDKK